MRKPPQSQMMGGGEGWSEWDEKRGKKNGFNYSSRKMEKKRKESIVKDDPVGFLISLHRLNFVEKALKVLVFLWRN